MDASGSFDSWKAKDAFNEQKLCTLKTSVYEDVDMSCCLRSCFGTHTFSDSQAPNCLPVSKLTSNTLNL